MPRPACGRNFRIAKRSSRISEMTAARDNATRRVSKPSDVAPEALTRLFSPDFEATGLARSATSSNLPAAAGLVAGAAPKAQSAINAKRVGAHRIRGTDARILTTPLPLRQPRFH